MTSQISPRTQYSIERILEYLPLAVALVDVQDWRLLVVNTLFQHTFLEPVQQHIQALANPITTWLPQAEASDLIATFRRVIEQGNVYETETCLFPSCTSPGSRWHWTIQPMCDSEGVIVHLLLASETTSLSSIQLLANAPQLQQAQRADITEHKRLEVIEAVAHSVRESLDLTHIGRAATDAILGHFDAARVAIHIAHPAQRELHLLYTGMAPGMPYMPAVINIVPYDSALPIGQAYRQAEPIITEDLQQLAATCPPGCVLPEAAVDARGYVCIPLWFKDHFEGTLTVMLRGCAYSDSLIVRTLIDCSVHIATALTHARLHAAVEHERARVHMILNQLPEGICIIEASSQQVSYVNAAAARILAFPAQELIGTPITRIIQFVSLTKRNGQRILLENTAFLKSLRGEVTEIQSQETSFTRFDGVIITLLASSGPICDENGTITGAVCVFQDITARKSVEQHKNAFLSVASHELRTPVTTIQGLAEILHLQAARGENLNTPRSLRAVADIAEQSRHLTRLIEAMLDISRLEQTDTILHIAPHNLLTTMIRVIETQTLTNPHHSIRLVLKGLETTDTLLGDFDEDRMIQVFNNLISNAIKYSAKGQEIEVGLQAQAATTDTALIWVKDHGIGIATHELPHIFERFHRASNFDQSISGLGIGLYLVKEFVTRHKGHVWAESVEGQGTTFFVSLPLRASQAPGI